VKWTVGVNPNQVGGKPPGTKIEITSGDGNVGNAAIFSGAYQSGITGEFDVTGLITDISAYISFRQSGITIKIASDIWATLFVIDSATIGTVHHWPGNEFVDSDNVGTVTLPLYLRISRDASNVFHTYYSTNGTDWTELTPSSSLTNSSAVDIWMCATYWSVFGGPHTTKFDWFGNTSEIPY